MSFVWLEAVHSVALSHEIACKCDTCKASHGDPEALARILAELATTGDAETNREGK